jgi:hypothetical protein
MPDADKKSIHVTDAMADLVAALEDVLVELGDEPSEALVRLTEATHRLTARWADYQESLDPVGWAETRARVAARSIAVGANTLGSSNPER